MMSRAEEIRESLIAAFQVEFLEVLDESEAHRGHAGFQEGGESHFRVVIKAPELDQLSRIERHRAIHSAIGARMLKEIHALAIEIRT